MVGGEIHCYWQLRARLTVLTHLKLIRCAWPLLAAVFAFAFGPAAHAQFAPSSPVVVAGDPMTPITAQMARDFNRGFYDDIIRRADELVGDETPNNSRRADPRLLYWRGLAFYQLAWYSEAIEDLTRARAGNIDTQDGGVGTSAILQKIERVAPFIPPQQTDVSSGGQVVFRVHYVSDNSATKTAVRCLAPAYRASAAMFDADTLATSVYIFDTYEQFAACVNARVGRAPESWVAAVTISNVLYLPLRNRRGESTLATNPEFFRSMVAHEFNHAMLRRLMGTAELPKWFTEGMADFAGGQVVPDDVKVNDYDIARLFAANALVTPTQLEYPSTFGAHTGLGAKLGEQGAGLVAPSPYAQSYHMMRYLLAHMKRDDLPNFLNGVRDNNSFSVAFNRQFGATVPEFYQSWYNDTARGLR